MDRHRGDRYSGNGNHNEESYHNRRPSRFSDAPPRFSDAPPRFSDAPPRFSDAPPRFSDAHPRFSDGPPRFSEAPPQINRYPDNAIDTNSSFNHRSPSSYRGSGPAAGRRPFESPPGHGGGMGDGGGFGPGFRPIGGGGFGPMDAGGFRPIDSGGGERFGPKYLVPPPMPPPQPLSGQKRGFPFSARGSSPDRIDGGNFAKLFVGSVPRTATEQDIRPLFEEHGNVIEVALIKDKKTGQQQGCCFIKYANAEEADRAIRALHNQHTLPGGVGPIQVRFADGERERLGAVEYKLFVGSLHKQATEKEVEEIFLPYGRVEDVYLMRDDMKQSRGCGFVKYSHRDMALAAINGLNGIFTMRGCDQPLTVRFADPKRPRAGDSRAPAFGGPGFGPRFQAPGPRPAHNFGDPMGDRNPPNVWHPMSPPNMGPSSDSAVRGSGSQLPPRSGDLAMPLNQSFNQPLHQIPPVSQQISPLQKPLQSPQQLPPTFQLQAQSKSSYSQAQASHTRQTPFSQAPPVQHLPASQPLLQQGIPSTTALQAPSNNSLPSRSFSAAMNQHHSVAVQQPPSDLAQMLSQQTQSLQASFQSSQQAFSKLQQQLQMIQPPNQNLSLQQNSQQTQHQWSGIAPQMNPHSHATTTGDVTPSTAPTAAVATQTASSAKCNWSEHTSPEGFKYYYNSVTNESKWEKPEELTLFEKQQQPQQLQPKPLVQQSQTQPNHPVQATQQVSQAQPMQPHPQIQSQFRQQQPAFSSPYGASGPRGQQDGQELGYTQVPPASTAANNPTRFQGGQPAQEWMWKSKPAGLGT